MLKAQVPTTMTTSANQVLGHGSGVVGGMAQPLPPGRGLRVEDPKRRPAKPWPVAKQRGCSQHTQEPLIRKDPEPARAGAGGLGFSLLHRPADARDSPAPTALMPGWLGDYDGEVTAQS